MVSVSWCEQWTGTYGWLYLDWRQHLEILIIAKPWTLTEEMCCTFIQYLQQQRSCISETSEKRGDYFVMGIYSLF